jgi:hypothetical protein
VDYTISRFPTFGFLVIGGRDECAIVSEIGRMGLLCRRDCNSGVRRERVRRRSGFDAGQKGRAGSG